MRGQDITPAPGSSSGQGEALRLTVPARAEVLILVDPAVTGGPFSAGLMTLPPGGTLPACRLLERDELVFFHKGQGRLTVDGRPLTVVPGASRLIARGAIRQLRNTGTGALQFLWVSSAGHEQFLRELARVADPSTLPALLQRHGVELAAESGAAQDPPPGQRHRRHRGRGRGGRREPQSDAAPTPAQPAAVAQSAAPSAQPSVAGDRGASPPGGAGRRRRRRRGGRGRGRSAAPAASTPSAAQTPQTSQPAQAGGAPRMAPAERNPERAPRGQRPGSESKGRPDPRRGRHRRGHVKEVYMGGKWIRVVGEGPVVSTGQQPPVPED